MTIRSKQNTKHITTDHENRPNGYLVPIYNIHDGFHDPGKEPQQVYLTVIDPRQIKGPHLHYIRTGCFTCIKGNARFVLKTNDGYQVFYSGESHGYRSVIVPTGVPAAMQNLGDDEAYVLNMPSPAWTSTMNDEHVADFSDFSFDDVAHSKNRHINHKEKTLLKIAFPGKNILLRAACSDQIECLREWKNAFREYFFHKEEISSDQQAAWFSAYQAREYDFMFIVMVDGKSIGCMGIRSIDGAWDAYNIILGDQQYRKSGIMSACFQKMLSYAEAMNSVPISLKVLKKNPADDWYIKQGFVIVSETDDFFEMNYKPQWKKGEL